MTAGPAGPPPTSGHAGLVWPAVLLVALTAAAYAPIRGAGFVNYDDDVYVVGNPHVAEGLSAENTAWAFTSFAAGNWHPLTWLSHQADSALFGLMPAGHHLTSVVLHAANAVLVLVVLFTLTGARWRSGIVAALFAVHPLNVESVAWVAERKNVLSTLFWLAGMWAYARYVRLPSRRRYAGVALCLALGLMSKPMVVTFPFVLLLLDWWPLRRWTPGRPGAGRRARDLAREKLPLFALVAAASAVTVLAQDREGAVTALHQFTAGERIANALVSYLAYLGAMVWPVGLAVFHPHPVDRIGVWTALRALALLAALTALAWRARHAAPAVPVGWLWYLGTLVPVIGLVQVGSQAWADRYAYVPLLGIFIALVWGLGALAGRRAPLLAPAAVAVLLALLALSRAQVARWESTFTLFEHAVRVTERNFVAHTNLAAALAEKGDLAAAERHSREALRLEPHFWPARAGLGVILERQGRLAEALEQQREALRLRPGSAEAYVRVAGLEGRLGHIREAQAGFADALRLAPRNADALDGLGQTLCLQGRWAEGAAALARAVEVDPGHVRAHVNLGFALRELGRNEEARAAWERAVVLGPADPAVAEARDALAKLSAP